MSINNIKNRPGRPNVDSEALTVRVAKPMMNAIDAFITKSGEPIGRPEAIRRILTDYLKRRGMLG